MCCADAAAASQHDVQRGVPGAARGPGVRAPLHTHVARRAQVSREYAPAPPGRGAADRR